MRRIYIVLLGMLLAAAPAAFANVFGAVRGVVHDPQHRPVEDAMVMLKAKSSDWARTTTTNAGGEFQFNAVPLGDYTVAVASPGFAQTAQDVTVISGTVPVTHFQLHLASAHEQVTVSAAQAIVPTDSATPTTLIDRASIQQTPGADRTNAVQMITDYVPATYVAHDMLHMRGGHQIAWAIDGVPVPNTNIANNLGPQIDPKDIDYLEVQRGSYGADYGDRTYGVFNIVPRTGFERDRECDFVLSAGNFYQTNDQFSCGGHNSRSAYYASVNGNRSNYGLLTPISPVAHDAANGIGGFASFIFNPDPKNQYRLVGSLRRDYYQIPIDPNPNSIGNSVYPSYGLHDAETEPDGYLTFSWVHTLNADTLVTVSPFYHHNGADYHGGPDDYPVISTVTQTANYGGMQASVSTNYRNNDLQAGLYGFAQHQHNYFYNQYTDGTPNVPPSSIGVNGGVAAFFVNDKFKVTPWLTLIAGLRETQFSATISENATDPRLGAALRVPRLNWTFRGFYGYYYQAPPLSTATSQLQNLASGQGYAFAPLYGERDIEWQFGVMIPIHSWILDADNFETRAHNWLDHNNIGESNIFWPITWSYAMIQGWELTLRSPNILHHGQFHLAYANQIARATSPITGGLICPPNSTPQTCGLDIPPGLSPVDHDQRNTLNVGFNGNLPWHAYASTNVYYGSGFTNGLYGTPLAQYPGPYLPSHTTVDLSLGKTFAERYTFSVTAINFANRRVQLDNSLTFGGFHWNDPRQIYAEFRYRFHY
ncbi:TonB-dependent receptor [Candidatus Sulfotelmatobacter kueseliae]|uniref:TonB-dependent receptor n=1 Tax=Candidatus Sulfotelmatobacter kueseliae TaxID=2042962 RepID=A0A2U3KMQ8_9BACT|nr:TonB-dependent receptor [Candidatus Sulfotelmatobacter kueseliae]